MISLLVFYVFLQTMKEKVIVSVTNDISTDQRVFKVCQSLQNMGFEVELIGRLHAWSKTLERTYSTSRIKTFFSNGPLFYLEFNVRLFFRLMAKPSDVLLSNDLDTLLANFLVSKLKKQVLVYDSHELFPETPELIKTPFKKRIWEGLESLLLPNLKHAYTVCLSIAQFYKKKYGVEMQVVRNLPYLQTKLPIVQKTKTIIYQGNMNPGRGLETAIESMKFLPNFRLKIIGNGLGLNDLKELAQSEGVCQQVEFLGRIPFEDLRPHTQGASIGLLLEEPLGLSFEYSLPNKLFDYIHASTPVLASPLVEVKALVENYPVGELLKERTPQSIAEQITSIVSNSDAYDFEKAQHELNWQIEEEVLKNVFLPFIQK